MPRAKPRGKPTALARWVTSLTTDTDDELLLLNAGMSRTVITRWSAAHVGSNIGQWAETVSQLCQEDANSRGGVCSYDLEHRRASEVRATYLVRRISADGAASSGEVPSLDGVVQMLMKHLEVRDKTNQQLISTMQSMTTSMVGTLIERLTILERERGDILSTERDSMLAQLAASSDIESRERMDEKLGKLLDLGLAQLASASQAKAAKPAAAKAKPNGAANKRLPSTSKPG